jgi:anti-sigma28 factor (negative regulator of flagellin synthesis)
MKISAITAVAAETTVAATSRTRSARPGSGDVQQISLTRFLQISPTEQLTREDLLRRLTASIQSGHYQCEPDSVADAMLANSVGMEQSRD